MTDQHTLLRLLPKVDESLLGLRSAVSAEIPDLVLKLAVRSVVDAERNRILAGDTSCRELSVDEWQVRFERAVVRMQGPNLKRVINGSGVVIHTNLGRSLLPPSAVTALGQAAGHYSNLEFNLETGKRGSRYSLVEEIVCDISGAEAALVVNNNAAAVLLVLETLAADKEVIVSRGQLVEIGGSFRIPDVMAKSGANMVEVGATNRTHLNDYEQAITDETSLLLKVHTSNFRIIGFTSEVPASDLVTLARQRGLAVMEDLGSGSLIDLSPYGLPKEPTVQEIVRAGVDVVTFSGDKLLGGPQAGIIVGRKKIIDRIKRNPLNRALRIDKFTLAALETILRSYYDFDTALREVPTLRLLVQTQDEIRRRARRLLRRLGGQLMGCCELGQQATMSRVGGGAMPEHGLPSWAVTLVPGSMTLAQLERGLRALDLPIVGRIENEALLLDMRTVLDQELAELAAGLVTVFGGDEGDSA
ncbi:MAG: L-seryl-tRNA(Sec) selenium transferase [Desulfobulbaceae bacterium]|uniref:L-seryl-tRNA(Sec) selenium transferase n=1 Tax=Candidatus Desulfatifera sulfidica TaxID=2841691 RepID=A0A8J6N933_9BACT|nr:L-seryl-tRNA(Sec) selenium transferase [Candidatus Desulfatifera sulfidica]